MLEGVRTEEISPAKKELLALEHTRQYLFHGSGDTSLEELEPRQGYTYKNGVNKPDEFPAVFASSRADYAILMAIVNDTNCPLGYRANVGKISSEKGASWRFGASQQALSQLTDTSSGVVYVFHRSDFEQRGESAEFRSTKPCKPIKQIVVTKHDLPPIEIIPDRDPPPEQR